MRRPIPVVAAQVDVRDEASTTAGLDGLVADVGVPDLVNLCGTIHVCRALVPHLRRAGMGTIVTTASVADRTGVFGYTGYCASKFAVLGFSEALRRELRLYGVHAATL